MAEMKGIKLCGECGNYDYKKHRCRIGCNDDSNAQASFYGDCPLPDVVPKSEVEALKEMLDATIAGQETLQKALIKAKAEVAEIIDEAFKMMEDNFVNTPIYKVFPHRLKAELKKKYTEE